jgi:hypothetical protein
MQDLAWEAVIFEVTAPAEVLTVASRCRTVNYSRSLRPRGHWKKAAFARGYALEPALGANLPYGFKTIDRWHKASGVATSIKTLDMTGKTYSKAGGVFNQLRRYIDTLSDFQGGRRGNVLIRNRDISSRVLRVGIEPGRMSTKQYMEVLRAYNYGKQLNVPVHLQLVPTTM